jgi:hypothetical protein
VILAVYLTSIYEWLDVLIYEIAQGRHGCGRWNPKNLRISKHETLTYVADFLFSLNVYVVGIREGYYCTIFSTGHSFVLVLGLRLGECILEESSSPGVKVLVFPLVVGIREISTSSSPAVEPGGR